MLSGPPQNPVYIYGVCLSASDQTCFFELDDTGPAVGSAPAAVTSPRAARISTPAVNLHNENPSLSALGKNVKIGKLTFQNSNFGFFPEKV